MLPNEGTWNLIMGSISEKSCVYGNDNLGENRLFSLSCEPTIDGCLSLTWLDFDDDQMTEFSDAGVTACSSFVFSDNLRQTCLLTQSVDFADVLTVKRGGSLENSTAIPTTNCRRCGTLLLKGVKGNDEYSLIPICYSGTLTPGWYFSQSDVAVYVVRCKANPRVSVVQTDVCELPQFASFIVSPISLLPSKDGHEEDDGGNVMVGDDSNLATERILNKLESLASTIEEQISSLQNTVNTLPNMKEIDSAVKSQLQSHTKDMNGKWETVAKSSEILALEQTIANDTSAVQTSLQTKATIITEELQKSIQHVLNQISSSGSTLSIEEMLDRLSSSLTLLRSYDDNLRDLVSEMSSSLTDTYKDILTKASDVALKDVSLSNSVVTLSEALEKLGSLRSLAERSDSALDSLVTLLPALSTIEANILAGAQNLNENCARLAEAGGKVEACAEQALSSTIASNNTLSAIKDTSLKKDVALVTMTALTAVASVASSIATVKQAKRGSRC